MQRTERRDYLLSTLCIRTYVFAASDIYLQSEYFAEQTLRVFKSFVFSFFHSFFSNKIKHFVTKFHYYQVLHVIFLLPENYFC